MVADEYQKPSSDLEKTMADEDQLSTQGIDAGTQNNTQNIYRLQPRTARMEQGYSKEDHSGLYFHYSCVTELHLTANGNISLLFIIYVPLTLVA